MHSWKHIAPQWTHVLSYKYFYYFVNTNMQRQPEQEIWIIQHAPYLMSPLHLYLLESLTNVCLSYRPMLLLASNADITKSKLRNIQFSLVLPVDLHTQLKNSERVWLQIYLSKYCLINLFLHIFCFKITDFYLNQKVQSH